MSDVVVITGANSGIGASTAYKFASCSWIVVMGCRNVNAGTIVSRSIANNTSNQHIYVFELDLSSKESIRKFVISVLSQFPKVDLLINNAGHFCHGHNTPIQCNGIEASFAVNAFGPIILSYLFVDALKKSHNHLLILNASTVNIKKFHNKSVLINFDKISCNFNPNKFNAYEMYGDSKMAFLALSLDLASKFVALNVRVNSLMIPSVQLETKSLEKFSGLYKFIAKLQNKYVLSRDVIADLYYRLATESKFKLLNGALINSLGNVVESFDYCDGFFAVVRSRINNSIYPTYAHNRDMLYKLQSKLHEYYGDCIP